jgi:hypothetical protein
VLAYGSEPHLRIPGAWSARKPAPKAAAKIREPILDEAPEEEEELPPEEEEAEEEAAEEEEEEEP